MAGDQPAIVPKAKPPREKKALDSVTETPKVLVQQNPDPESGAYFQEVTGLLVSWDLDGKRFSSVSLVLGTALDIGCSQVAANAMSAIKRTFSIQNASELAMVAYSFQKTDMSPATMTAHDLSGTLLTAQQQCCFSKPLAIHLTLTRNQREDNVKSVHLAEATAFRENSWLEGAMNSNKCIVHGLAYLRRDLPWYKEAAVKAMAGHSTQAARSKKALVGSKRCQLSAEQAEDSAPALATSKSGPIVQPAATSKASKQAYKAAQLKATVISAAEVAVALFGKLKLKVAGLAMLKNTNSLSSDQLDRLLTKLHTNVPHTGKNSKDWHQLLLVEQAIQTQANKIVAVQVHTNSNCVKPAQLPGGKDLKAKQSKGSYEVQQQSSSQQNKQDNIAKGLLQTEVADKQPLDGKIGAAADSVSAAAVDALPTRPKKRAKLTTTGTAAVAVPVESQPTGAVTTVAAKADADAAAAAAGAALPVAAAPLIPVKRKKSANRLARQAARKAVSAGAAVITEPAVAAVKVAEEARNVAAAAAAAAALREEEEEAEQTAAAEELARVAEAAAAAEKAAAAEVKAAAAEKKKEKKRAAKNSRDAAAAVATAAEVAAQAAADAAAAASAAAEEEDAAQQEVEREQREAAARLVAEQEAQATQAAAQRKTDTAARKAAAAASKVAAAAVKAAAVQAAEAAKKEEAQRQEAAAAEETRQKAATAAAAAAAVVAAAAEVQRAEEAAAAERAAVAAAADAAAEKIAKKAAKVAAKLAARLEREALATLEREEREAAAAAEAASVKAADEERARLVAAAAEEAAAAIRASVQAAAEAAVAAAATKAAEVAAAAAAYVPHHLSQSSLRSSRNSEGGSRQASAAAAVAAPLPVAATQDSEEEDSESDSDDVTEEAAEDEQAAATQVPVAGNDDSDESSSEESDDEPVPSKADRVAAVARPSGSQKNVEDKEAGMGLEDMTQPPEGDFALEIDAALRAQPVAAASQQVPVLSGKGKRARASTLATVGTTSKQSVEAPAAVAVAAAATKMSVVGKSSDPAADIPWITVSPIKGRPLFASRPSSPISKKQKQGASVTTGSTATASPKKAAAGASTQADAGGMTHASASTTAAAAAAAAAAGDVLLSASPRKAAAAAALRRQSQAAAVAAHPAAAVAVVEADVVHIADAAQLQKRQRRTQSQLLSPSQSQQQGSVQAGSMGVEHATAFITEFLSAQKQAQGSVDGMDMDAGSVSGVAVDNVPLTVADEDADSAEDVEMGAVAPQADASESEGSDDEEEADDSAPVVAVAAAAAAAAKAAKDGSSSEEASESEESSDEESEEGGDGAAAAAAAAAAATAAATAAARGSARVAGADRNSNGNSSMAEGTGTRLAGSKGRLAARPQTADKDAEVDGDLEDEESEDGEAVASPQPRHPQARSQSVASAAASLEIAAARARAAAAAIEAAADKDVRSLSKVAKLAGRQGRASSAQPQSTRAASGKEPDSDDSDSESDNDGEDEGGAVAGIQPDLNLLLASQLDENQLVVLGGGEEKGADGDDSASEDAEDESSSSSEDEGAEEEGTQRQTQTQRTPVAGKGKAAAAAHATKGKGAKSVSAVERKAPAAVKAAGKAKSQSASKVVLTRNEQEWHKGPADNAQTIAMNATLARPPPAGALAPFLTDLLNSLLLTYYNKLRMTRHQPEAARMKFEAEDVPAWWPEGNAYTTAGAHKGGKVSKLAIIAHLQAHLYPAETD